MEHSNWGSAIVGNTETYSNDPYYSYQYRNEVYGSNFILCKSLIGSISSIGGQWQGTFLDASTLEGFLSAYVNDAPFCDTPSDFTTINVRAFDDWNMSTGYVYYSTLLTTNFPYVYDGYTYDNPLAKGAGYLITGSDTTVASTIFTTSNLLVSYLTTMNSNGGLLIEQEHSNVTAHILTASGETSTLLSTVEAFDINYYENNDNNNFRDLFYVNIGSSNSPNSFLYTLSNDGTLLTSNIMGSNDTQNRFSGRNGIIYEYTTSNVNIIQNGILASTIYQPYGEWNMRDPYPDFANGDLAITSYDNDSNTIITTVTNNLISTFSTTYFTSGHSMFLTQSYLMMWQDYPFKLLARDMNAGTEYGFSTIGNLYEDTAYNQADSICFKVYDDVNALNFIVFNFSTTTFTILSASAGDNQNRTFSTSPYWD